MMSLIWLRKEKLRLINIIQEILKDENYNLREIDEKVILSKGNCSLEEHVEIEKDASTSIFTVFEVHRSERQIRLKTEDEVDATICAVIIYKRLYDDIIDRRKARQIRNYMNAGENEKALSCSIEDFDDSVYSIGYEDNKRISLMQTGGKIDIKFGGEYLAKDVTVSRGYVILYNYCKELQYIFSFYENMQNQLKSIINPEKMFKWYILGK